MILRVIIPIHTDENMEKVNILLDYNKSITIDRWEKITFHIIRGDFRSRSHAMNHGSTIHCDPTDYVMFLHCDTKLPVDYSKKLYEYFSKCTIPFCFFQLSFDTTEQLISPHIIEHFVNESRKEPYGDQCFTMSYSFFRNNGVFTNTLLLEDVIFYRNIQQRYGLVYDNHVIDSCVVTSDRRFRGKDSHISEATFLKNVCNNRIIILLHKLGVSSDILGTWYYRNGLYSSLDV
jgi:hypothetical protein